MSENINRKPILYNGETYAKSITKSGGGGDKAYPATFEESKTIVLRDIANTKETLRSIPEKNKMPTELIISITMHASFSAKSYYPETLFDTDRERFGLKEIGSRVWKSKQDNEKSREHSKMFFVRANDESLSRLEQKLLSYDTTVGFQNDIRKVSSIGVIDSDDQILGLPDEWVEGQLEAVLHPFDIDKKKALSDFLVKIKESGVDENTIKFKQYDSGITFISFKGNRDILNSVAGYNPLRTLHPLQMRELPNLGRSISVAKGPDPSIFTKKPTITIGVIDGGIHNTNPYISNYVVSEFSVSGSPVPKYLDHGTRVAGAVLFGPLNKYTSKDSLPEPYVSVKSFGVLSSDSGRDPELYSAIDAIENIVPSHNEIKVYNISLGPSGPILDDSISRFTYSLDLLSYDHDVLFCVAVGNDGEIEGFDRIQSPADSVNCLAVGAFTHKDGIIIRAPYSSIGPGREGCKMKPDLLAFGGCDNHPIHLVSSTIGTKISDAGTSFASPIVAGMAGRLIGESSGNIDALTAKALLIHSTSDKFGKHTNEMGHGILPERLEDVVDCKEKSYTLIYRGKLESAKYAEFPIPWDNSITEGSTSFKWTVAVLTDIDHLSTDDYTSSTVEIAFYPNSKKYEFKNKEGAIINGKLKKSEIVDIDLNPERAEFLIANGFKRGSFPKTGSTNKQYKNETDLRDDLKWDSLDTREVNKKSVGIRNPAFHIHALGRGTRLDDLNVKYALILTVTAPKASSDIYTNILNKFPALLPIEMVSQVKINIES